MCIKDNFCLNIPVYFLCSVHLQIVEWLNEVSLSTTEDVKVANICKVQEILLNKEPHLLQLYLGNVLEFAADRNAEVRKTIIGFVEEAGLLSMTYYQ